VPGDPATYFFGAADGGVWKTTDAGVTWRPLFDRQGSASIGALVVAPSDPDVIWVGTGQLHQRWDIVDGDGVYRSTDGGASWTHLGLTETRHVGAIWVDPRDADVAIVAALGHVFGPNPERGLYRTEDGGATWTHVLDRGSDVGAVDVTADPKHPETLYAALWQVRRHPWLDYFESTTGPGSGIVKSSDGGRTWNDVGRSGLPEEPMGRIELAAVRVGDADRIYAAIEGETEGGLYRSDDGGASWRRINDDGDLGSSYMSGPVIDPRDPESLWAMGRGMQVSHDGGATFEVAKGAPGGDDYHCLWVDPTAPERRIVGADQGAVITLNDGESWSSWYNQPTGQFYRLAVDDAFPWRAYSGQQDSGTVRIASRSDYGQLTFRDWTPVGGDERDGDVPDPADLSIVYGAGLGGRLSKWDERTGQVQNVAPWPVSSYGARPGTTRYRYDWITPLAVAPRPPYAIYVGAQVLFRSLDRGQSWETVSPDLTGTVDGAEGCDGDVPVERATACGYGVIFSIAPSPAADGVVWVGTTSGRLQVTRDDGATWTDVTPPGLPDWAKVNHVDASASDPATAYVAADRHRGDDRTPYVFRTHDFGATWNAIGSGLPDDEWVGVVREDPKRRGLLYAGTNRGMYVSFDDGDSWRGLQLDLPTTGINDLRIAGDDLAVATQGRAIWILDQLAPLRDLAARGAPDGVRLAPPGVAYRLRANQNKDTPLPPEEPRGENPPPGAILDYWLPEGIEGPVTLEIVDGDGDVVRRFASDDQAFEPEVDVYFTEEFLVPPPSLSAAPGPHRFTWNVRGERPRSLNYGVSIAAVPGREAIVEPEGAFVVPGTYRVRFTAGGTTVEQPLEVRLDPRVATSPEELEALAAFQADVVRELERSMDLAEARAEAAAKVREESARRSGRLRRAAERALTELDTLTESADADPGDLHRRLSALATDLESVDAAPTGPQRQLFEESRSGLDRWETAWKKFDATTLRALERRLGGG